MLPSTDSAIGVGVVFESAFGEKPPLKVNSRLPARTLTGFSAVATPATLTAIRAARAIAVNSTYAYPYLSFAARSFGAEAVQSSV